MAAQISKKKKFVADGVLFAELNELLTRELAEEGYSGVEVRVTPSKTEVVIRATRTQSVLGERGRRIRELTAVVQKRFAYPENSVELFVEKVANRGLCAIAQAESLRYKLVGGLAVRRACYGVLRFVMENGAKVSPLQEHYEAEFSSRPCIPDQVKSRSVRKYHSNELCSLSVNDLKPRVAPFLCPVSSEPSVPRQ